MRADIRGFYGIMLLLVWRCGTDMLARRLSFLLLVAGVLTLCASSAPSALAERRIALVIGNGAYRTSPLRNPVNDARGMASALRGAGFDVTEVLDGNQKQIQRAIIDFGRSLKIDDVGLFYYSGHGVQVGGRNYMIPLGAEIEVEDHVEVEGVDLARVLARMAGARNRMNIVVMDACRNNPFKQSFRFATQGLAEVPAPPGTYVAYAASPGQVASDGFGDNSIYTGELIRAIGLKGLEIDAVFKRVRTEVLKKSNGHQVSWTSSSITEDFFFTRGRTGGTARLPTQIPKDVVAALYEEFQFWEDVRKSNNPAELEAYLARYPNGNFIRLARDRLDLLEQRRARAGGSRQTDETTRVALLESQPKPKGVPSSEVERKAAEATRIEAERRAAEAASVEAERQAA